MIKESLKKIKTRVSAILNALNAQVFSFGKDNMNFLKEFIKKKAYLPPGYLTKFELN